jgi:hypothetical protein
MSSQQHAHVAQPHTGGDARHPPAHAGDAHTRVLLWRGDAYVWGWVALARVGMAWHVARMA